MNELWWSDRGHGVILVSESKKKIIDAIKIEEEIIPDDSEIHLAQQAGTCSTQAHNGIDGHSEMDFEGVFVLYGDGKQ